MSDVQSKYKDSLNLPKTDFPMKGDLPINEPIRIAKWESDSLYKKFSTRNTKRFTMPDGPPYANGNIHVGHVLNKVLKDIVIKYKNMSGHSAAFIPGWDCHGLPIELGVTKQLGSKRKEIDDTQFRNHCREFAMNWVNTQRDQFKRLGILADWENPYLTLQKEYEAEEVRQLAKMLDSGAFYKGDKPVYWCWALQTALADTEVEYHEHTSPTVYVKFELLEGKERLGGDSNKKTFFVIWTTTPWTLPANLAIALNPDLEYALYEVEGEHLLFAKGLIDRVEKEIGKELKEVPNTTRKGSELEGLFAQHPFIDRKSQIILGDHVTLEAGSGSVHTAPGHGAEDYIVGKKYGLEVYSPVDAYGKYTAEVPEYQGLLVFDANPLIIERLKESGHLLHASSITHSYPHCWRTKKPLIFRATPQWFLKMDHEGNSIRSLSLEAIKQVQWLPSWGQNRITAMVENRPDWCLSRQRLWGVPIPVFQCVACNEHIVSSELMNKVADKMEKGDGLNTYFSESIENLVGKLECPNCKATNFEKGKDILDVWFDSGVCHAAVQDKREQLDFPADLYLEGSDQHRGWFQTSLLTSIATKSVAPFKTVLTHGFVNDLQGKKMSKSQGNVVDPKKVIDVYGAEMLRLWTAYEDYAQDLTCGDQSFKRLSETYRRIRNTMRFLLGNIHDFQLEKDSVKFEQMLDLDRWAMIRLNQLVLDVNKHYSNYEFYKIYHALNQFVTVDLSAVYLDILKDRLYTSGKNSLARKSAQTCLFEICEKLCKLMAPILSFLAEETYSYLPGNKADSIFLTDMPEGDPTIKDDKLEAMFSSLLETRSEVSKHLEDLRRAKEIGSSLEAEVQISAEKQSFEALKSYEKDLADFFIVSKVELSQGPLKILAKRSSGDKCPRCWKYKSDIGSQPKFDDICNSCAEALDE